jgi:hypothetical protein
MALTFKERLAIGVTSATLVTGLVAHFQPPSGTPDEQRRQQLQQDLDQLDEAQSKERERMQRDGEDHAESERRRKLVPGEHRPPELPRLRLRP